MKVIDPGHLYELGSLDGDHFQRLQFVKREGLGYPGNVGTYPGTTVQDVLRVVLDRLQYVNTQQHDSGTTGAACDVVQAILKLENRAARRHKRPNPTFNQCLYGPFCTRCGHAGCEENCHD